MSEAVDLIIVISRNLIMLLTFNVIYKTDGSVRTRREFLEFRVYFGFQMTLIQWNLLEGGKQKILVLK